MRSFAAKALLVFLITFSISPLFVQADTLTLSPASGSYAVGKTIPLTVYVSSPAQSVNAVSGTLTFPTDKLQVVSVSKAGSVLSLWVTDPTFSNGAGTISFEGVVPNPGFQGSAGKLILVTFKVIGSGSATVKWSSASELANDGQGTNILKNLDTATFTLSGAAAAPVEAPLVTPSPTPARSGGLAVTSKEFPNSSKWYSHTSATFQWNVTDGVTAVRTLVGKLPNSTPTVVYDPPVESKTVDSLDDGVWYFHVQAKSGGTWGPITHYQFKVDTTAPDSFTVKPADNQDPGDATQSFVFAATDATSDIDHYTVSIDGGAPQTWRDDGSGIYTAPALRPGKHTLAAKAFDEAGNSTAASLEFGIVGSGDQATGPSHFFELVKSFSANAVGIFAIVVPLIALIYLLVLLFVRGTHHVKMTNRKFRSELHDMERMVDKAFELLREDVEDSIRLLERTRTKRRLTQEEDAIIERLRSNLRDAEKVIHGEVRRVEKELD